MCILHNTLWSLYVRCAPCPLVRLSELLYRWHDHSHIGSHSCLLRQNEQKTRCTWRVFIGSLLIFTPNCFPVKSFLSIKRKRSDKHHLILVWSWEFCDNSRNNLCTFNCMNEISYPIDGLSHNNLGWDIFTC